MARGLSAGSVRWWNGAWVCFVSKRVRPDVLALLKRQVESEGECEDDEDDKGKVGYAADAPTSVCYYWHLLQGIVESYSFAEEELAKHASLVKSGVAMDEEEPIDNASCTESESSDSSDGEEDLTDDASGTKSESTSSMHGNEQPIPKASYTESESSNSSDDVIVLDHKPADWIDRPFDNTRKRCRDNELIVLEYKPVE
ncbi:uncharacterized protein EDB93DRAFT_1248559 [Suillus bovinus]|uniref:uncharacterized protein n=1 Tax=Suillus bovinus TaxID=48563 RepID=UPI001B877C96|nr:uncharacterized protein EDB93DRAFT_1248559 [Suillus bovinus]KAG2153658.1 hypothetical protein EDB93DRAFT_1248559 [Suillus bovinus]